MYEWQFDWGGRLLKSNGGAQRQTQKGKDIFFGAQSYIVCLTERPTSQSGIYLVFQRVGDSDPVALCGKAID